MVPGKISSLLVGAVICSLLSTGGCRQLTKEGAVLALKFTPQESTTYKVIREMEDSVKFEGFLPDEIRSKGARNYNRLEMTFDQQTESTDEKGNAIVKITVRELKFVSVYRDSTIIDFDWSREKDQKIPLAQLIGKSYTIEVAPTGKVQKVIDIEEADKALRSGPSAPKMALRLITPSVIMERHGTAVLPDPNENQLRIGDSWSSIKSFDFRMMGSKSYERIYTLKEIKSTKKRQIAIVEMSAIPSSEMAEQLHKEQATIDFSNMFDNTETYTGRLRLDLNTGKVEKYFEELQSDWIAVDPAANEEADSEPAALRMSATRLYSLEKID